MRAAVNITPGKQTQGLLSQLPLVCKPARTRCRFLRHGAAPPTALIPRAKASINFTEGTRVQTTPDVATGDQHLLLIVGTGLAGTCCALTAADANPNLQIIMYEKEAKPGGNSMKASSGINCTNASGGDSSNSFKEDTLRVGKGRNNPSLVDVLVEDSPLAIEFLRQYGGMDLDATVQLGGHSIARTRSVSHGANVGFGIMKSLGEKLKEHPNVHIVNTSKVDDLLFENSKVCGVEYTTPEGEKAEQRAAAVIIATGGFGAAKDLLRNYVPHLAELATTNGPFATGDGHKMAVRAGAGLVDMDAVQLHPTGFVDPSCPDNLSKILAPERLRGQGGILLDVTGKRFVNELAPRYIVSDAILEQPNNQATMLLDEAGAQRIGSNMDFYTKKGLFKVTESLAEAAELIGTSPATLESEIKTYNEGMASGNDAFGKSKNFLYGHLDLEGKFYIATITPAVHYSMGGIRINDQGQVLDGNNGEPIEGLWAAGEVTGGVHGANRLGGNSLLDCVVFGRRAGLAAAQHLARSAV